MNENMPIPQNIIRVCQILQSHLDDIVIVGGNVPQLYCTTWSHRRTFDVDFTIPAGSMPSIRETLTNAGFVESIPGQRFNCEGTQIDVLPFDRHVPHEMLNMEGYELAFEDFVEIELPNEHGHPVCVKVAGPAAFVTMKTIAFAERGIANSRDLQDIWFILKEYGTFEQQIDSYVEATDIDPQITYDEMGAFLVGRAMRSKKVFPSVAKAIDLLRNLFRDIDAPGVTTLIHFVGSYADEHEESEAKAASILKLFNALRTGFAES